MGIILADDAKTTGTSQTQVPVCQEERSVKAKLASRWGFVRRSSAFGMTMPWAEMHGSGDRRTL